MNPIKSSLLAGAVISAAVAAVGFVILSQVGTTAQAANPAAAKRGGAPMQVAQKGPCGANPCAAKPNPCAAQNPCNANPCAARNPCGPSAGAPANPCAAGAGFSAKCTVPGLRAAAANPCAAKNPCNPCAPKKATGPCGANPCAAKKAGGANPCGPCSAAEAPELTPAQAAALNACLRDERKAGYAKSGDKFAAVYTGWKIYNTRPYTSATHGGRYMNNYANAAARHYIRYEKAGKMPEGAVLAKDSFIVDKQGRAGVGPLFLMEKMGRGFNKASHDWRYTMIMPTGAVVGTTNGKGSKNVAFCIECHVSVAEDQDSMMFLPEEVRVTR